MNTDEVDTTELFEVKLNENPLYYNCELTLYGMSISEWLRKHNIENDSYIWDWHSIHFLDESTAIFFKLGHRCE